MEKLKDFLIRYAEMKTMDDTVLNVCYLGDEAGFEFVQQICDVERFEEGQTCEAADLALLVGPKASAECAWQALGWNQSIIVTANCSVTGSLQSNFSYVARIEDENMTIYSNCKEAEICFKRSDDLVVTTIPPSPTTRPPHTPPPEPSTTLPPPEPSTTLPPAEPTTTQRPPSNFGWKHKN